VLAAKSVTNAVAWLKGAPAAAGVPASAATAAAAIAPGVSNAEAASTTAYAVRYTQQKVPEVFKAEVTPAPAENTANRETLTAATTRVLGNDKIPPPNYTKSDGILGGDAARNALLAELQAASNDLDSTFKQFQAMSEKLKVLENQQVVSQQQFDAFRAEFNQVKEGAIQKNNETYVPVLAKYDAAIAGTTVSASKVLEDTGDTSAAAELTRVRSTFFRIVLALKEKDRLRSVVANDIVSRAKELKKRISTNVS
jgi:hypothetical protein